LHTVIKVNIETEKVEKETAGQKHKGAKKNRERPETQGGGAETPHPKEKRCP
jgi:hypothetical protein